MIDISVMVHVEKSLEVRSGAEKSGPWLVVGDSDGSYPSVTLFFGDIAQMEKFALAVAEAVRERKREAVEKLPVTEEVVPLGVAVQNGL